MTVSVVPFLPTHLDELVLQGAQQWFGEYFSSPHYGDILCEGPAYTAIDGEVLCCAGVIQLTQVRWQAWVLMSHNAGPHLFFITRKIKEFLETHDAPRIETPVRSDFKEGHRWMGILEFECETPNGMKSYGDDGYDYHLYARINDRN